MNRFFVEKEIHSRISSVAITDSSDMRCLSYIQQIYLQNLQRRTDVMKVDTLSFICYCSISKFITKVQIERHKYINILGTHCFVLLNATLGARRRTT